MGSGQHKTGATKGKKGRLPWAASWCCIANGDDEGCTKLLLDVFSEAQGH